MMTVSRVVSTLLLALALAPAGAAVATSWQAPASGVDPLHKPLDDVLDLYVRDGLVYYRALRSERGRLDRYIASLNVAPATYDGWSRERQMAFWVNAYNVFVLKTVVDHYPIRGRSDAYPASSIRQIPGAFEKLPHRAAGRTVTLDQIEKEILPAFQEPRLFLALGRGAVGSGRLRSEAYTGARLATQLDEVQREFVSESQTLRVDRVAGVVSVTPIVSWNAPHFIAAYDTGETGPYAQRSPIERAIIAFIAPNLLPLEREFVEKNAFRVEYHPFDWSLNDLTGR
jgi:hypothetical protein